MKKFLLVAFKKFGGISEHRKALALFSVFALCMISPALAQTTVMITSTAKALPASSVMAWDGDVKSFGFTQTLYNFKVEPFLMVGDEYVPLEDFGGYFPDMVAVGVSSSHESYIKFYVTLSNIPPEFYDKVRNFGYRIVMPEDDSLRDADVRIAGGSMMLKGDLRIDYSDLESSGYTIDLVDGNYVYVGFEKFRGSNELSFDPTIQLQTADTQNLGDTYVNEGAVNTNYGTSFLAEQGNSGGLKHSMLKFNISSVPLGQSVDDARVCMYLFSNPLSGGNSILVGAYHLFQNYTCGGVAWNESCPTWNLRPNSSVYNSTVMSTYNFTSATPTGAWYCWNVTASVARSYSQGYQNSSVYMIASVGSGSPASDIDFRSKEFATASFRPYLNITYHDISIPQWSLNSTNSTVIGGQAVLHSTYWTDLSNLSMFIFSTNITGVWLNDTAVPFVNGWANVTKTSPSHAVVGWQFFANDTSNNWNSTPVFSYAVYNLNLTASYPSYVDETGNYSVLAYYYYNFSKISNATLEICYTFTTMTCDVMTEGADYYYWNFSYDHDVGGIVQFNITASYDAYPNMSAVFYITFFDMNYSVRFWEDLNKTTPYINEFLWVYAKPHCNLYDQIKYFGLYSTCNTTAYHAKYAGGVASLGIWSPNTYDLYIVDGTVYWNCTLCEPSVVGYNYWSKFDEFTVSVGGNHTEDYFWNTTVSGRYPLFGNLDWNFWLSVAGMIILLVTVVGVAYLTQNGIAVLLAMVIVYILLKLFGILTGAIFWIF